MAGPGQPAGAAPGSTAPGPSGAGPAVPPAGQPAGRRAWSRHTRRRRRPGCPGHPAASARPRSAVPRRRGPGRRSPRSRRLLAQAGPRPTAPSTTCGPVPGPPPPSTASPGSSACCPCPARRHGRTSAPGWSSHRAAASCSHPRPAGSAHRPSTAAAGTASDQRSRATSIRPAFTASYKPPWPRRCSGTSDKPSQGAHRPAGAQHRIGQLKQRVRPPGEAPVQLTAESCQPLRRSRGTVSGHIPVPALDPSPPPCHAVRHGHRLCLQVLSQEPEDHRAVAVSAHGDTPDKISNLGQAGSRG